MNQRLPEREAKVLSEQLATRVLTRASELDAALKAGASVAELRRAALEAGISAEAFEAALAEVQDDRAQVPDVSAQPRSRRGTLILAAVIVLILAFGFLRMLTPSAATAPIVEAVFPLRCLAPAQAVELVRPLMRLPQNTVVASPANAPGVLTVRGTPDQIQNVQALLNQHEGASACAAAPPPARAQ